MTERRPSTAAERLTWDGAGLPGRRPAADRYGRRRYDIGTAVSGIVLVLGLWLLAAPWVLGYSDQANAVANQALSGSAIAVLALGQIAAPQRLDALGWGHVALGAWLILAPLVLTYQGMSATAIATNDVVVGALVLGLSGWMAARRRSGSRA